MPKKVNNRATNICRDDVGILFDILAPINAPITLPIAKNIPII